MSWPDDESTMQCCSEEWDVSMPPEGAFLTDNIEPVGEIVVGKDGALGQHRHSISPTVQPLLHSMPMSDNTHQKKTKLEYREKKESTSKCWKPFYSHHQALDKN
jgi:hypothetical protein